MVISYWLAFTILDMLSQIDGHSSPHQNRISEGSIVRIIAPSGKGTESDLPRIKKYVEDLGLVPIINPNIYSDEDPLYSNTDEFRANDLKDALLDEEAKVIWCIKGGEGAARLVPILDKILPSSPIPQKVFIGFSDISVLHSYLGKKYNWRTIHGTMLEEVVQGFDKNTVQMLENLIFARNHTAEYTGLKCLANCSPILSPTKVVGGCLTLVQNSIKTSWEIETKGNILLLEDTHEKPYRNERTLDHLRQSGLLDEVAAVLLGEFRESGDEPLNNLILQRFADSITKPVFQIQGVGHGETNKPIPLNSPATISQGDGEGNFTISIEYWPN